MTGVLLNSVAVGLASALTAAAAETAAKTTGDKGRLVDVGGHKLFYRVQGKGTPLIVLETGITETFRTWEAVTAELAKLSTVLVYDRAGYGQSEAGPRPRTCEQEVAELARLLDKVGGSSPVVLAGHSLGGVNALVFASRHPERTAGVVVLDPPPLDFVMGRKFTDLREKADQFTQQFKEMAAAQRKQGNDRKAAFFEAVASEHEALFEGPSRGEFDGIKTLGSIPLTVVSSEKPNPQIGESAEDFQRFWIRSNEQLSRLSSGGSFVLATNASHHIHLDAPETVIRAVRQIVEKARQRARAEPATHTNRGRLARSETISKPPKAGSGL